MTPHQRALCRALGGVTFCPGIGSKRFAREMAALAEAEPGRELTGRQAQYLEVLAWRYRRQMPAKLVPRSKPADLPPKQRKRQQAQVEAPPLLSRWSL